jgi:glycosyltransferase involved in cell wall biosynthesis
MTILIPCLNEVETIGVVIEKSKKSLEELGVSGEILIADNGSEDGSKKLAISLGARVIDVPLKGYGAALINGILACDSEYIVMGDADDSYALDNLKPFISELEKGYDLVIGNRFKGGIAPGAMPWLHKHLGNPVLSWLGRTLFKVPIGDFHCGLRAFRTHEIRSLQLRSIGMEFASEMIVKAQLNNLRISEVPTELKPDGRSRAPHLRTWRDGWRHLVFLLAASPRFLFFYPGFSLLLLGSTGFLLTISGSIELFGYFLDSGSYLISIGLMLVGIQTILMGILARIFSTNFGMLPKTNIISRFQKYFKLERGIILGLLLILLSFFGFIFLFSD